MITHIVDSDWTIDYLKGKAAALDGLNALIAAQALCTSIIVVGEVQEGTVGNEAALRDYEKMLRGVEIHGVDRALATTYAELRSSLRKSGMLMSDNDTWIAATALHHDLTLISRDKAFDRITELKRMR